MGAWGPGLYANDVASDLKGTIAVLARLPVPAERLLEMLVETAPAQAENPDDEEHTAFWLVAADQFAKKGVDCRAAREKALFLIASGADLAAMAALDMDEKSLKKRAAMLEALRQELSTPTGNKPRKVLKTPEKLLFEVGEALVYPVGTNPNKLSGPNNAPNPGARDPIDPHGAGSKKLKDRPYYSAWRQDGWGAMVIAERGHLFDYLAWYRPIVINRRLVDEPALADLLAARNWLLRKPGALTARHRDLLQIKSVGRVAIDRAKWAPKIPERLSMQSLLIRFGSTVAGKMATMGLPEETLRHPLAGWETELSHIESLHAVVADRLR
jgi:hypothetical protein